MSFSSSGRSSSIRASLTSLANAGNRRFLAVAAAGGLAGGAILALWLATSSPQPGETVVEVPLPPAAEEETASPAAPGAAPLSADPAAADPATVRPGAGNALTVPPVAADAFASIPLQPPARALPPAPDPALVEASAAGPLPKRAADGRLPWQVYARPLAVDGGRAPVAVVVAGLGRSAIVTREVIRRLPADVTLAFEPAADVADWGRQARSAGHEIMLSLPVQGSAFPFVDRGPEALAGEGGPAETRAGLHHLLAQLSGYVGVLANVGAEEADGDGVASPALELAGREFALRGLLLASPFLDKATTGEAPQLSVDLAIGPDADAGAVRSRLAELEATAVAKGHALAVVEPTPAAAGALAAWAATLSDKRVVLAPVSAVAKAVQAGAR